jgi:hypothetical protein
LSREIAAMLVFSLSQWREPHRLTAKARAVEPAEVLERGRGCRSACRWVSDRGIPGVAAAQGGADVLGDREERFGVQFRAGDMVLCNLPLARLDERKNTNPELFDLDRKNRSYLIFSTGPHLCLGHFLARVEMKILFTE